MRKHYKIAVALDEYDFMNLKEKLDKAPKPDLIKTMETPENIYRIVYWEDAVWDYNALEFIEAIKEVRHAVFSIPEHGEIWSDIQPSDARGTDEVFHEILFWTVDICMRDDMSPLAPEKEYIPMSRERVIDLFKAYVSADYESSEEVEYVYTTLKNAGCTDEEIRALGFGHCIPNAQ